MLAMDLSTRRNHEPGGHIRSFEPNQVCFDKHGDDRHNLIILQTVSIGSKQGTEKITDGRIWRASVNQNRKHPLYGLSRAHR